MAGFMVDFLCVSVPFVALCFDLAFILPILCIHVSPVSILDGLSRPTESYMDEQDKQDENLNPQTQTSQCIHVSLSRELI